MPQPPSKTFAHDKHAANRCWKHLAAINSALLSLNFVHSTGVWRTPDPEGISSRAGFASPLCMCGLVSSDPARFMGIMQEKLLSSTHRHINAPSPFPSSSILLKCQWIIRHRGQSELGFWNWITVHCLDSSLDVISMLSKTLEIYYRDPVQSKLPTKYLQ